MKSVVVTYLTVNIFDTFQVPELMFSPQDRLTLAEKNERLQSQLRSLKEDLVHSRDDQVCLDGIKDLSNSRNFPGRDHYGQDPQGEREAGSGQVQDPERSQEGEHEEEGRPVREHVRGSWSGG